MRNYHESSSPLQVMAKNETNEPKQISLFGSEFNDFENEYVQSCYSYVTYPNVQKSLLHTIYGIDKMRIILQTKNSKGNFDTTKSKNNLKDLVISVYSQDDVNGQAMTIPLFVKHHISPKQFQKNIADIKYELYLDGSVALNFTLPPKTEVTFTLFPFYKNKLGTETYYGEFGLIKMIENIKHPFSEILVNKINEAKKIKTDYEKCLKDNSIVIQNNYYSRVIFDENVDELLFNINDIPADIYRNMVDLYIELNNYIGYLRNQIEHVKKHNKTDNKFSVNDFVGKLEFELDLKNNHEVLQEINELKNKTENVLRKRKNIKKESSKKENKKTLDIVSKKVNNKKSSAKKVVKNTTNENSKK